MEGTKKYEDFYKQVNHFVTSSIDDLTKNINNQQQGILVFNELKDGFKDFQDILTFIKKDTLNYLPEFKINELISKLSPLFQKVTEIQNITKNPNQTDVQQKQPIIKFLTHPFQPSNPTQSGYFAREKDTIWNIIVQAISLENSSKEKDIEAKTILKRLKEIELNATESEKKLGSILTSAQSELSKSGVEKHAEIFREQAALHKDNSETWKKYSMYILVFTLLMIIGFFFIIAFGIDSADDERKSQVLIQATQTIFSHQSSGFLSKENYIQNPNPVIEIAKNIVSK